MEGNNKTCAVCGAGADSRCGACGMGRGYMGNQILRWVLGILIITWVFSIGVKFGEIKSMLNAYSPYGYGSVHMRGASMPMMTWTSGVPVEKDVVFTTSGVPASGAVKVISQ